MPVNNFDEIEILEVKLKYGGMKGIRMSSGTTSSTEAVGILLADLVTLRAHRPKSENIRQEGATFFLSWPHRHAYTSIPLERSTLYSRWQDVVQGDPRLNAVKEELYIESVTMRRRWDSYSPEPLGPTSPLGPKHTIEFPGVKRIGSHAEYFTPSHTAGHPYYSQQPSLATEGKRPRSNSGYERGPHWSEGNGETHSQKRIRTEQPSFMQNSALERGKALDDPATRDDTSSQIENKTRPATPSSTTSLRELRIPPYISDTNSKPSQKFPGVIDSRVPTGPRSPEDREAVKKLSLHLSKVREGLGILYNRERVALEELARLGVSPQPLQQKIEETKPSQNALEAQLILVEAELQQEKMQRLRAEQTLSEVEKECRSPFVVPALFQAFRRILDIGRGV